MSVIHVNAEARSLAMDCREGISALLRKVRSHSMAFLAAILVRMIGFVDERYQWHVRAYGIGWFNLGLERID
jgi:hypothetical protein